MTAADMVLRLAAGRYGFVDAEEVAILAADPATRLRPLLVRCGAGRATVAAQDVAWLTRAVEAGGDYVRDVSVPAGATARAPAHEAGACACPGCMPQREAPPARAPVPRFDPTDPSIPRYRIPYATRRRATDSDE